MLKMLLESIILHTAMICLDGTYFILICIIEIEFPTLYYYEHIYKKRHLNNALIKLSE